MKKIQLLIPLLLCIACMKDVSVGPNLFLGFDASLEELQAGVKSSETEILQDDMITVSMCGEHICDGVATRADRVSGIPDRIRAFGYRYRAPWTGNEPPVLLDDALLTRSSARWLSDVPILTGPFGTDLSMRFFAYAPDGTPGLEVAARSGAPALDYTVPVDAADQQDILFGSSDEIPASGSEAFLHMRHILSAVTFAVDDACSDCVVTGISLRGIYCTASYTDAGGWTGHTGMSTRGISLCTEVAEGTARPVSGGPTTMMLIPQTVPDDAILQITVLKEGETFSLDAPISGCVLEEGCSYVFRLSFTVNLWDSTFTYHIRMAHKPGSVLNGTDNISLPGMYFEPGTQMVSVDWGDGSVSDFTKSPATGMKHFFPTDYEGDVVVKVRGSSPKIIVQGNYVQRIARVDIEGSDLYDSRDGCNCIIDTATGDLVYAGIEYTVPSCVRTIRQFALATVEDTELVIPEGVTCLYSNAASGPNKYTKIVRIPSSVTTIYDGAFSGNEIRRASVDEANPVYDSRRGCGCIMETATDLLVLGTQSMEWPVETRGVRTGACEDNPVGSVTLPPECLEIRSYSFSDNISLGTVSFPAGSSIEAYSFYNCGLKSVDIPQGCRVDEDAFRNCGFLTSVSLHCPLAGDRVFMNCKKLSSLELWDGFSASGTSNFLNCPLTEIRCHCSTPPDAGGFNLKTAGTIHVPSGADWTEWLAQMGFDAAGWTIVKDL